MKLDKDKSKAVVGTIVAHLLIILVLFFMALRTPLPLPEEEGIEVDLGNSTEGIGDFQTNSPASSQAQEQPEQSQDDNKTKPSDNASEETATEDNNEAPAINDTPKEPDPKKNTDKTKQEEPKQEEPKQQVIEKAMFKNKSGTGNGTGDQQGGSEGITGNPGDQGNTNGLEDIKQYVGPGGSGNGVKYSLGGRGHKKLVKEEIENMPEEGTVVVDICVDREGNVIRAKAGAKGTNTLNTILRKKAEEFALDSKFESDPNAPDEQCGTMTYDFVFKTK